MIRQSLQISDSGSSRSTEHDHEIIGVLIQTVSIGLGVCLVFLAFWYAGSFLD
jgi:hypothetical protein